MLLSNRNQFHMTKKRPALFDLTLAIDAETSGIAFGSVDPTYDVNSGEAFQALSFGLIVANVHTLQPIDELYVEIKFDGENYTWSEGAQRVHGMSREYLEANGLPRPEAAQKIVTFIEKYFGPISQIRKICLLGHNVATFDRYFLIDLLQSIDAVPQFGNRHIDTFSLGVVVLSAFSSDELFDTLGMVRDPENHNALQDAKYALKAARMIHKFLERTGE